jgi:hypothetical protein
MVSVSLSLEPPASGFKRMTALADNLIVVFEHPADPTGSLRLKPQAYGLRFFYARAAPASPSGAEVRTRACASKKSLTSLPYLD